MAVSKKSGSDGLLDHFEKALRRGKKLERTLLKIVARNDPGSELERFLKSVQHGLKALKEARKGRRAALPETKKKPVQQVPIPKPESSAAEVPRPAKRVRKKRPAVGDQSSDTKSSDT